MVKRGDGASLADLETSLCFGRLTAQRMDTNCKPVSDNVIGRKLNWSDDGKTLLAFATTRDGNEIGMLGYTSKKPFSADPDDWKAQGFVTDTSKPGQGVIDAAFSPDGKTVAVAAARQGRALRARLHQAGRPAADRREAAERARVQGDLAAGRAPARRRAGR